MNLLIAGSRSIKEYDLKKYVPEDTAMIITGGANGIDTLAEKVSNVQKEVNEEYVVIDKVETNDECSEKTGKDFRCWYSFGEASEYRC